MRGKWNNDTKRYETSTGKSMPQEREGYNSEDIKELEEIEQVRAEGGTYLERYAKKLGVDDTELFKNILENNSMDRFNSVKTYYDFTMLKQTLVEEKGPMGAIKAYSNIYLGSAPYKY